MSNFLPAVFAYNTLTLIMISSSRCARAPYARERREAMVVEFAVTR